MCFHETFSKYIIYFQIGIGDSPQYLITKYAPITVIRYSLIEIYHIFSTLDFKVWNLFFNTDILKQWLASKEGGFFPKSPLKTVDFQ